MLDQRESTLEHTIKAQLEKAPTIEQCLKNAVIYYSVLY